MSIVLVRVDDRLIHGQVVVGWVQALGVQRIVLVDDEVSANEWERELYRLSVPAGLAVEFASVDEAARLAEEWGRERQRTLLLAGDVDTIVRLCSRSEHIKAVNVGGLHDGAARSQRLSYVYLSDEEAQQLHTLSQRGVEVSAQDVPTARAVPLGEFA